jgi:hypothetical protein
MKVLLFSLQIFFLQNAAGASFDEKITGPVSAPSSSMAPILKKIFLALVPAEDRLAKENVKISSVPDELRGLKKGAKFSIICDKGRVIDAELDKFVADEDEALQEVFNAELKLVKDTALSAKETRTKQCLIVENLKVGPKQTGLFKRIGKVPSEVAQEISKKLPPDASEFIRVFFELRSKGGPSYIVASLGYKFENEPDNIGRHSHADLWLRSKNSLKKLQSFNYFIEPLAFTDLDQNGKWELFFQYSAGSKLGTDFSEIEDRGLNKLKSVSYYAH